MTRSRALMLLPLMLLFSDASAQPVEAPTMAERFDHWPLQTAIAGRILAAADVPDQDVLQSAIGTFQPQDRVQIVLVGQVAEPAIDVLNRVFKQAIKEEAQLKIETFPSAADAVAAVRAALQNSSVCCVVYGKAAAQDVRRSWMQCQSQLQNYVQANNTLLLFGDVIHDLGIISLADFADAAPQSSDGLNLFPDVIMQPLAANASSESPASDLDAKLQAELTSRLLAADSVGRRVGLRLTADAVVELNRRRLRVHGSGTLTVLLPCSDGPMQQQTILQQTSRRQSPDEFLIDLTQWRRMARDQTLPAFPPAERQTPLIENGTLLIVGGGGMPENLMQRMIELAGGAQQARLVYIPCSEERTLPRRQAMVEFWKKAGVQQASVLHTKDRLQAQNDAEFLEPLRTATGIWFGGGRQWNFADSYYGTTAHQLMQDVLKRGGVIGGSSAGASIQGEYLARATPILNVQIMAPGYERGGLGFLKGVAIDQHFSQRARQKDLSQLVQRYPQLLGIGIDEGTALVVQQSQATVVGKGQVWFYQQPLESDAEQPEFIALPEGSRYNLATRQPITDP